MDTIVVPLLLVALLPVLTAGNALTKSRNPRRTRAGIGLLGLASLAAAGIGAYTIANRLWADLALTALALLAVAIQWDLTLAQLGQRRPHLTAWLLGFGWGSSTNRRRPSR